MAPPTSTSSHTPSDLPSQGSPGDIDYLSPTEVNLINTKVKSSRNLASLLAEKIFTKEEILTPTTICGYRDKPAISPKMKRWTWILAKCQEHFPCVDPDKKQKARDEARQGIDEKFRVLRKELSKK